MLYGVDQWDVQATIQRVNESLIDRGYITWFDLTNMKGNEILSVLAVLCIPFKLWSAAVYQLITASAGMMQAALWTQ